MTHLRLALVLVPIAVLVTACAAPAPSRTRTAAPSAVTTASQAAGTSPVTSLGDLPPEAALLVREGDAVVGQLGGYTWGETGSDAPWLPGTPVTVDPARSLRFGLSFEAPVDDWSASYRAARDPSTTVATPLDAGGAPLEVEPPPAGTWSLAMTVVFGGGLGSATYYWQITVP